MSAIALSGRRVKHKLTHICCQPGSQVEPRRGRHLYICNGCSETNWGSDSNSNHLRWREEHFEKCFRKPDYKLPTFGVVQEKSGTQSELLAAIKRGEVPGIKWDKTGPRGARFNWSVV